MQAIKIALDKGSLPELAGKEINHLETIYSIAAMPGGMQSGHPSVGVFAKDKDGKWFFTQTSLELFISAADAMRARFYKNGEIKTIPVDPERGDPTAPPPGPKPPEPEKTGPTGVVNNNEAPKGGAKSEAGTGEKNSAEDRK